MKFKTKNVLREMAKHLGLKVSFVSYFGDDVHGKLLPREKRILINAHKPRCEHVFTLLHEFGHFLLHFRNCSPRRYRHWLLDHNWRVEAIANLVSRIRRQVRYFYNTRRGKEWEADVWAMCALVCLSKFIGDSHLMAFLNRHPEKTGIFWLAVGSSIYCDAKNRIVAAGKLLATASRGLAGQWSRPN